MKTVLISIIETIIFCGRHEIVLRGTCDSGNIFKKIIILMTELFDLF
jgi:hypothetical protein